MTFGAAGLPNTVVPGLTLSSTTLLGIVLVPGLCVLFQTLYTRQKTSTKKENSHAFTA